MNRVTDVNASGIAKASGIAATGAVVPAPAADPIARGRELYDRVVELYPICRSITGEGVRQTLSILARELPLTVHEVPTGTAVFDWVVPEEWNIRDAWIRNTRGERVVDFRDSNLHVVSYSVPVRERVSRDELLRRVATLPEHEDWIPYRTTYYERRWGFCMQHRKLQELTDEYYDVCIDASLQPGHLTYGEYFIPGERSDEVLFSCHVCHPSLCNDNLSGVTLAASLARHLAGMRLRYSYRFLFIPGTIGSIAWLAANEEGAGRIRHGLVLACVGRDGAFTYKKSRRGNAEIDRVAEHVLRHSGEPFDVRQFSPYGYDERQFCSPGFNLPVGCLSRVPHGEFPEYHTSADNLDLVTPHALSGSFDRCLAIVNVLEHNATYVNLNPKCEPQLGKRGLYRAVGGPDATTSQLALLWVLNLSDGDHTLLDIAERADMPFGQIQAAASLLERAELVARHG
jgi:aminopeptidase-like protein